MRGPECRGGLAVLALAVCSAAQAYGPVGHRVAGLAAEPLLCERAAAVVAELGDGQDLGELGLWADQIRSNPAYANAAPWHFMNVADDSSVAVFEHPPEGDVLWAIDRFSVQLADASLDADTRGEALRFLVHFVVDLHQPLHVGRESDRGGNAIELRFRGENTNLHRLWDTNVIEWTDLSLAQYVEQIRRGDWAPDASAADAPVVTWAEESFALRGQVYRFDREGAEPSSRYLDAAADLTGRRLGQAAVRLAATLNGLLCFGQSAPIRF